MVRPTIDDGEPEQRKIAHSTVEEERLKKVKNDNIDNSPVSKSVADSGEIDRAQLVPPLASYAYEDEEEKDLYYGVDRSIEKSALLQTVKKVLGL